MSGEPQYTDAQRVYAEPPLSPAPAYPEHAHAYAAPQPSYPSPQPSYVTATPPLSPYLDSPFPDRTTNSEYAYPPPSPTFSASPHAHILPTPPGSPRLPISPGKERAAYAAGQGRGYGYGGPTTNRMSMMNTGNAGTQERRRQRLLVIGGLAALVVVIAVVAVMVSKQHGGSSNIASNSDSTESSTTGSTSTGGSTTETLVTTGGDGSIVVSYTGDTFVYNNSFGGFWFADPTNPLYGGRANSWTPLLNETWAWGIDRVHGVNLGGWFVLEPFIAPALFQRYPSAGDEWSLSQLMRADGTLQATLETHYDTFITEKDIAQIAGAGLNWVRVPIPFWAVSTWADVGTDAYTAGATNDGGGTVSEPFLEGVCWKYVVRLLGWARKYGIRVNLDLHTIPGSQNGYNHSGKMGQINFLNGPMGVANAQRALDYIRIITEFIAQDEWQDVVQIFGVMNEAVMSAIGRDQLYSFYLETHNTIRAITGFGAGNGPYISVHDGFEGTSTWAGFMPGSDRIILDTHPYFSFGGGPNNEPIATGENALGPDANGNNAGGAWPGMACSGWGPGMNASREAFGITIAGEFSNGFNDCGLYLHGVNGTTTYGGDCNYWQDASQWNSTVKAGLMSFALAQMDALTDWFFWTWKIGPAQDGIISSPLWSYQAGLEGGWMPPDPRVAVGKCVQVGVAEAPFVGTYSSWQTGGAGAGTIAPSATAQWGQFPPPAISNVPGTANGVLLTYTATASIPSLAYVMPSEAPTGVASKSAVVAEMPTASMGSGWKDEQDTDLVMGPVAGCVYPDAWNALGLPAPTAACA